MSHEEDRPNALSWSALFGGAAALVAGIVHAVLGYYVVTGATFDWLEWTKRPVLESEVAGLELAISTFLITLLLASVAGALTWSLTKRGKMRAQRPETLDEDAEARSWSEFSFWRASGMAFIGAALAGMTGFLLAEIGAELDIPGAVDPSGITGQGFFVFKIIIGALIAGLAAFAVAQALARAQAAGTVQASDPRGNVISRIQLWSSRNAATVVFTVLVITAATGMGITKITTDVDVADVLPRGNGNTTAAQNLTTEFKSTFTQQVTLQFQKNPDQCERDSHRVLGQRDSLNPNQDRRRVTEIDCNNITDEVYVRALDEFFTLLLEEDDTPIRHNIGMPSFYKLINWTIEGGQDAPRSSFSLPGTSQEEMARYAQVEDLTWRAIPDVVTPVIDPSFDQTASLYLVSTDSEATSQEIGGSMLAFRDTYVEMVEDGDTTWRVFGEDNPPLFTVDLPVANHHQSELAREDFTTLFPLIFGFIVVSLYFAFRNLTAIGIAGSTLLASTVWTYGLMGHFGIPLNTLNLTVLPLILGTGIDFAIHQVTEFAHLKQEGKSDEEALRISGSFAGFAMFIATVTSVSGLLVMTISPSLLMAQLGLLAAIAITSVYMLTITFMPALLTLAKSSDAMGQKFEPSGFMAKLAGAASKQRVVVAALVLLLTAGAVVGTQKLGIEEFGEPAKNFPEDDPLRIEHEQGIAGFYDLEDQGNVELKTNIIVFEGDNTDIQAHRYIDAIQAEMANKPNLNLDTSRTMPFLMRTWLSVKDGGESAGPEVLRRGLIGTPLGPTASETSEYPQTREAITSELDAMFESPLRTFSSLFVDHPGYNISTMTLATTTGDFEDAEAAWDDVWASVEAVEGQRPHDLQPAFVGNTALNFLFISEELPWLNYLGIVSGLVLAFLTAIFTKSLRATTTVSLVMGLTGLWWLGVLPAFDIGLAITLMLPAVFITSIGSDYAIHMTWNLINNPDREEVYGVVGKAVLFSAITDIGAFAIFTQTQNVAASKAMVATVLAIGVMFLVTVLVVPLFYPLDPAEADEPGTTGRRLDDVPRTRIVDGTPLEAEPSS